MTKNIIFEYKTNFTQTRALIQKKKKKITRLNNTSMKTDIVNCTQFRKKANMHMNCQDSEISKVNLDLDYTQMVKLNCTSFWNSVCSINSQFLDKLRCTLAIGIWRVFEKLFTCICELVLLFLVHPRY